MTNKNMKYLIVEDNPLEIEAVKILLPKPANIITTFSEARDLLETENYDGVLSDLFFPFGEKNKFLDEQDYINRVVTIFEDYVINRKNNSSNGVILEEALELIMASANLNSFNEVIQFYGSNLDALDSTKDQIEHTVENILFRQNILETVSEIKKKKHDAPMGLAIYEVCKEKQIPCVIVTGDYHHGPKFQALCSKVGRYVDTVSDKNLKGWEEGYQILRNLRRAD